MICLELLGMSRAGKTTQRKLLQERLALEGFKATTLERPKIPFSEFNSLVDFHDFLIDFFRRGISSCDGQDFVILDRGLYDRQILLDFDYDNSSLSPEEYSRLRAKIQNNLRLIKKGYVFMVSPEESLKRWIAQREAGLDYSSLNLGLNSGDTLDGLSRLYRGYLALLKDTKLQQISGIDSKETCTESLIRGIRNG